MLSKGRQAWANLHYQRKARLEGAVEVSTPSPWEGLEGSAVVRNDVGGITVGTTVNELRQTLPTVGDAVAKMLDIGDQNGFQIFREQPLRSPTVRVQALTEAPDQQPVLLAEFAGGWQPLNEMQWAKEGDFWILQPNTAVASGVTWTLGVTYNDL